MTKLDIEAIKARADAATPGPWEWQVVHPFMNGDVQVRIAPLGKPKVCDGVMAFGDVKFIAHARTDVPRLVAALRAVLVEAETWSDTGARVRAAITSALGGEV